MTQQEREEGDLDILILRSVLGEMDFYTGRWTGGEGVPRTLTGPLAERSAALLRLLSSVRFEMHDMMCMLEETR